MQIFIAKQISIQKRKISFAEKQVSIYAGNFWKGLTISYTLLNQV